MPRTKLSLKPNSKRESWTKANMIEAVKAVREKKMHLKKAVKVYSVPKTTLQRFVPTGQLPNEVVISENDAVYAQPTKKDDACCIFGSENYSNYQKDKTWIQCQSCRLWAHIECSGCDTECYICDLCM